MEYGSSVSLRAFPVFEVVADGQLAEIFGRQGHDVVVELENDSLLLAGANGDVELSIPNHE